jgi:hypothetical protein
VIGFIKVCLSMIYGMNKGSGFLPLHGTNPLPKTHSLFKQVILYFRMKADSFSSDFAYPVCSKILHCLIVSYLTAIFLNEKDMQNERKSKEADGKTH